MKKIIFCSIALVAGLVSCTEDYTDWSAPQSNAANEAVQKFQMTVTPEVSAINFATETQQSIKLFSTNVAADKTDGYTVNLTASDTGSKTAIEATSQGVVLANDLIAAVKTLYGNAPEERTMQVDVEADVTITTADGDIVAKKTAAPFILKATLEASYIAPAYYVIGGALDWAASAASREQKFNHSSASVYDDPVFTITIAAAFDSEGNRSDTWFAIADDEACDAIAAGDWSKLLGTTGGNGDTSLSGTLATRAELGNDGSICMPASDQAVAYKITINMEQYSYEITPVSAAPEQWYLVGSCIGDGSWGNSPEKIGIALFPLTFIGDGKLSYTGYFTTDGFKLIKTPGDWNDQWGQGASGYVKNDGGSGNITVAAEGYYTVTLDYMNDVLTIEPTAITPATYAVGIAGSFNGWSYQAMENCPNSEHLWMIDLTADSDEEGKFLIDGWSVNWGDTAFPSGIGTQNGPNIPIASGSYTVIFNDITGGYNFISK